MLLALLPLLLSSVFHPLPQEDTFLAPRVYQGPHCAFPYKGKLEVVEFGTGWGVVVDLYASKDRVNGQQPLLRVTSIPSSADPAGLAEQILGLDQEDLKRNSWVMDATGTPVNRVIDGADRSGTSYTLNRNPGTPNTATYTLYAWGHDGSVNMVRTVSMREESQGIIDACLDRLVVTGIHGDSKRKVGLTEFGFLIPANWQSNQQELGNGFQMHTLAFPSGNVEALFSPEGFPSALEELRNKMMRDATSRLISMSLDEQGDYLGKRRGWLNVDGRMLEGRIHQWKDGSGNLLDLPIFAFIPGGLKRVVQLQLLPNPAAEGDLLSEVTRTTRSEIYRATDFEAEGDRLKIPGFSIPLPRGMNEVELLGDNFSGGQGVVLGKANDGGPRWFFWGLPQSVSQEELPELQALLLQKWIDRDFMNAEVLLRQTVDVEVPGAGTYQGLAWTVKHTQVNRPDDLDWISTPTRNWMCAIVAIPYGATTLLAVMQVDDRDKFPMIDDFSHYAGRAMTTSFLHPSTIGFDLTLSKSGPWSFLHHPGKETEAFVLVHPYGRVQVKLRHYTDQEMADGVPDQWASHNYIRSESRRIESNDGEVQNLLDYGFTRVGNRDVPLDMLTYRDTSGGFHWKRSSGWMDGNTRVLWVAESGKHNPSFSEDLETLAPAGGQVTNFLASEVSFAGVRLPVTDAFQWQARGGLVDDKLHLLFHSTSGIPVTLEFLADPGESISDQELLQSLLPEAPEWNELAAHRAVEVEQEIFGRAVKGLRRVGQPVNGPTRWQEVYVDRRQGVLWVLRLDGPESLCSKAQPVLKDLFAAIRPEEADYIMNVDAVTDETRISLALLEAGPLHLAIPEDYSEVALPEGESGWKFQDPLGIQPVSLFPYSPTENLLDVMSSLVLDAKKNPAEPQLGEEAPIKPHSFIALMDGHTFPGLAITLNDVPTLAVTVSHQGKNYLLMVNAWTEKDAKTILRNALTGLNLVAK